MAEETERNNMGQNLWYEQISNVFKAFKWGGIYVSAGVATERQGHTIKLPYGNDW